MKNNNISEEIISGFRQAFEYWYTFQKDIYAINDDTRKRYKDIFIAGATSSHERILELENENSRLKSFCNEFVYGEENPNYYKTMQEKLTNRDELLKSAKIFIENGHDEECSELWDISEGCRHDDWVIKYEQLEQEK